MTNTAEQIDFEEVPSGGIGDFVMSDDDFATLEKQNSRQEFGDNGIAEFEDIASRMASYGRFGDDRVVHVETGELIVPRKLIDQSPALKESIFQHLREAGIEDPERYVVGSAENSFNPETGLMEFGFFSKIFKGIKKHFKKVGKVLKKAAPIILGIVLTPIVGPIYAGALAGGIGTLIQGGNIKDAFKAALVGGATGAVFSAGSGALSSEAGVTALGNLQKDAALSNLTGGFSNVSSALTAEGASLGERYDIASGKLDPAVYDSTRTVADQVANAQEQLAGGPTSQYNYEVGAQEQLALDRLDSLSPTEIADTVKQGQLNLSPSEAVGGKLRRAEQSFLGSTPEGQKLLDATASGGQQAALDTTLKTAGDAGAKSSYFDTFKDYMVRGGDSQLTIDVAKSTAQKTAIQNYLAEATINGGKEYAASAAVQAGAKAAGESAFKAAGTSMLAKYGPSALALTGIGAAGGFFDVPQQEQVGIVPRDLQGNMITGADLIDANPEKYQIFSDGNFSRNYIPDYSQTLVASTNPGTVYGETGGQVFPRRNGGIMMDEGVPNEDSVRAMLMPGEFVMTTNAVRGAGNGNVDQGIKNMYEVMRGLERRGGAMS